MYTLSNEPQGIGKTLDNGFRLFFAGFKGVILLAFIAALLNTLPNILFPGLSQGVVDPTTLGIGLIVMFIFIVFCSIVLMAAIIAKLGATAQGEALSIGAAIGRGLSVFFPVLFASILYAITITIGLVLLIIPGIILSLSLIFYSYVIVLDSEGPISALKSSHNLVWGNWWRTATILTIAIIILIALFLGIGIPMGVIVAMVTPPDPMVAMYWIQGGNVIVTALITPLLYAISIVIYNDLKVRKGGTDLAARIETTAQ